MLILSLISTIDASTWEYSGYQPPNLGNNQITIFANDSLNDLSLFGGFVFVVDTTPPTLSGLTKGSNTLDIGEFGKLTVDVTDLATVTDARIAYKNKNYFMSYSAGNNWDFNFFRSFEAGDIPFTIWLEIILVIGIQYREFMR